MPTSSSGASCDRTDQSRLSFAASSTLVTVSCDNLFLGEGGRWTDTSGWSSACAAYPEVRLTLHPDTDAATTARYCAARLGAAPAATADFTAQLRRFLAAHVSVRVETDALESAGLGRLHVTVAPSESSAEAVVSAHAIVTSDVSPIPCGGGCDGGWAAKIVLTVGVPGTPGAPGAWLAS
jgi:hypothetical protein